MPENLEKKAKKLCKKHYEGECILKTRAIIDESGFRVANIIESVLKKNSPYIKVKEERIVDVFLSWQAAINYFERYIKEENQRKEEKSKLIKACNENPDLLDDEYIALQYFED